MSGRLARVLVTLAACATAIPARAQTVCGDVIEGDAALVAALRARLEEHGCPHASPGARIEITGSASAAHLVLRDAGGAIEVRDADDIATAALLVASWSESAGVDLLEPGDAARVAVPQAPATSSPPPAAEDGHDTPAPAPSGPAPSIVTIHAHGAAAFGNEGSSWFGAHAGACVHAGPTCIGASFRYLVDGNLSDGTPPEGGQRTLIGGDVDVALPIGVGAGFTLVPTLAVGLAWLDDVVVDGRRTVDTDGLRVLVSGAFSAGVALLDWLSLDLTLALTWSPLARQQEYTAEGAHVDPDPVILGAAMLGLRAEIR